MMSLRNTVYTAILALTLVIGTTGARADDEPICFNQREFKEVAEYLRFQLVSVSPIRGNAVFFSQTNGNYWVFEKDDTSTRFCVVFVSEEEDTI